MEAPGQFPRFMGERIAQVSGTILGANGFIQVDYNETGVQLNPASRQQRISCTFTSETLMVPAGEYTVTANVGNSMSMLAPMPGVQGQVSASFASLSLTVFSGDVMVTPEPGTWLLSGLGLLAAFAGVRRRARRG